MYSDFDIINIITKKETRTMANTQEFSNGIDFIQSLQNSQDYGNESAWEVDSWPNYEEWHQYWNDYSGA